LKSLRRLGFAWMLLMLAPRAFAATPCDSGLALGDLDPLHGAAALELCDLATEESPGIVSASYGPIDFATAFDQLSNAALGVGLLDGFGPNVSPRRGARMLALSSGTARAPDDPNYGSPSGFDKGYTSSYPPGLPYEIPACPGMPTEQPHDSVALRLTLRAPASAHSFSFRSKFHTYDYPSFICSSYNDWFVVLLDPAPASGPNIVFDAVGNPVTVNSKSLIQICEAQPTGLGLYDCISTAELIGTGFDEQAATPWLYTEAPIEPGGTITLTFGIFDAGDGVLDSTVLLDDFRWSARVVASPATSAPEPSATAIAATALAALAARRRIAQIR
jgi:hypothetical protein